MPTTIYNHATILSVFPLYLEQGRRHNGLMVYQHPPADKNSILVRTYNPEVLANTNRVPEHLKAFTDEVQPTEVNHGYSLIRVCDTFQWTRDFTQDSERFIPHPLNCGIVADDLRTAWASGGVLADGNAGPGMVVIAGAEPTTDELAGVRSKQTDYFRRLVNDGHAMFAKGLLKDISDLHRAAAKWLGANNLPWVPKIEQVELKKCPACDNDIRKNALRCQECMADLPDFYLKYGLVPDVNSDPVVAALLDKLASGRKTTKAA